MLTHWSYWSLALSNRNVIERMGPSHSVASLKINILDSKVNGADRTQVGPMLAPWTLLSGVIKWWPCNRSRWQKNRVEYWTWFMIYLIETWIETRDIKHLQDVPQFDCQYHDEYHIRMTFILKLLELYDPVTGVVNGATCQLWELVKHFYWWDFC